jgi:hypothetical protein
MPLARAAAKKLGFDFRTVSELYFEEVLLRKMVFV